MALQTSGQISFADILTELGQSGQAEIGSTEFRTLASVLSGEIGIDDFYGGISRNGRTITG